MTIRLADGSLIEPGRELSASLPARLQIGDTLVEIESRNPDESAVDPAALRTIRPPLAAGSVRPDDGTATGQCPGFGRAGPLVRGARRRPAGRGLITGFLCRYRAGRRRAHRAGQRIGACCAETTIGIRWLAIPRTTTRRVSSADGSWTPSSASGAPSTTRGQFQSTTSSLLGVTAVVASPILDESQEVIGAVYGARRGAGRSLEIRPLEAQLTQVLAAAVAAGLARLESEAQAARRRVQFEQFFTPDLAAALDRDPALLDGSEREVTVLFADIRGFSAVSEKMLPRLACELIRDIMEHLTARIMESSGVVVDYIGDGLLAMWNAPLEQSDHAARACRAALAMRDGLPELNRRWEGRIGRAIGLGIGINSGPALVGNTGSLQKFKYGPLGHTVNLASRVEGATKHLGVSLLITGSTRELLGNNFATRRLCRARVVGIAGEVELHELHAESASPEWQHRCESYEQRPGTL